MEFEEYDKIIKKALADFVMEGGSVYYIGSATREYFFEYEDKNLSYDGKNRLNDKAIQSIIARKPLPQGIRLIKCVLHGKKVQSAER